MGRWGDGSLRYPGSSADKVTNDEWKLGLLGMVDGLALHEWAVGIGHRQCGGVGELIDQCCVG